MLGSEVKKPSKILTKTSNVIEYIESNIQIIKALRTNDLIIWFEKTCKYEKT